MTDARPKLFVLDTNVILHDSGCIRNFEENDVAIPITVLEELDRFKRGNEDIHFQAREFLRRIDALTGDVLSTAGSPLGDGLGSIRVVLGELAPRPARRVVPAGHARPPDPADGPGHPAGAGSAAGDPGLQRHQPADEGQVARAAGPRLHLRQGAGLRQALHRQANGRGDRLGGDRPSLRQRRRAPGGPSAARAAAAGQRKLRPPQRQQVGPGDVSPRGGGLSPGREADLLRDHAAERRAVVRPAGPDRRRDQARHARRHGRHRQDAPGPGRGARVPPAVSADPPGPAGGAALQPRPRLPARATSPTSSIPTCSRSTTT